MTETKPATTTRRHVRSVSQLGLASRKHRSRHSVCARADGGMEVADLWPGGWGRAAEPADVLGVRDDRLMPVAHRRVALVTGSSRGLGAAGLRGVWPATARASRSMAGAARSGPGGLAGGTLTAAGCVTALWPAVPMRSKLPRWSPRSPAR